MDNQRTNSQEIRIPTSYGYIAAKVWGKRGGEPVIALHGWQDNAGTFDTLIPLLSPQLCVIAIDLPGHGLSSHKPPGTYYHFLDFIISLKHVIDYLKWDTCSFIGHSMGGRIALLYCSIFPERVKNIVLLDILKPASRERSSLPDCTREGILSIMSIEKKLSSPTPVYSYEEAQSILIAGLQHQVSSEAAAILLRRGCQPSKCGKGVVFSRDIRVKVTEGISNISHEDLKAYLQRVCCNVLIIRGESSFIYASRTPEVNELFVNLYQKNCKSFKVVALDGNHFVHLNNSDLVAPHINNFFKTHNNEISKL